MQPFYIGQEVVCIKTHSQEKCIKNTNYIIKALEKCKCGWNVDIGAERAATSVRQCTDCGYIHHNNIGWCASTLFVPITSTFQSITLEKVLELETPFISVN